MSDLIKSELVRQAIANLEEEVRNPGPYVDGKLRKYVEQGFPGRTYESFLENHGDRKQLEELRAEFIPIHVEKCKTGILVLQRLAETVARSRCPEIRTLLDDIPLSLAELG